MISAAALMHWCNNFLQERWTDGLCRDEIPKLNFPNNPYSDHIANLEHGRSRFKPCLRPGYFLLQLSDRILETWMLLTRVRVHEDCFFKKMGIPRPLFHLFSSFQTHITNFTTNMNVNIRWWDSNSWPLEHESPPITTRPGLPPTMRIGYPCKSH